MKRITQILTAATVAALLLAIPTGASAAPPEIGVKIGLPSANSWAKTLPSLTFTTKGAGLAKTCSLYGPGGYEVVEEFCSSPFRPGEVTLDGDYSYGVTVEDGDGQTASDSVSFHVDQTAPTVKITSGVTEGTIGNATLAGFSAVYSDANLNTVSCRFDTDAPTACGTAGAISIQYTGFGEGWHKFSISAVDRSGNVGYAERNFMIDRTKPTAGITLVGGEAITNDNTPAFLLTGSDAAGPVTKRCAIEDQIAWSPCNADTWVTPDAIGDGTVTAWIEVTDRAGNQSFSSYSFTLDASAPMVTITGPAGESTTDRQPAINFVANDAQPVNSRCGFDPPDWASLKSCDQSVEHRPSAPLSIGEHQFWVASDDGLGNVSSSVYSFRVVEPTTPGGGDQGTGGGVGGAKPRVNAKLRSGKIKRGRFSVRALVTIAPANGQDCAGKASISLKPAAKGARAIRASLKLQKQGAACVGRVTLRVPAKLKRSRMTVSVRHHGSDTMPAFNVVIGKNRV